MKELDQDRPPAQEQRSPAGPDGTADEKADEKEKKKERRKKFFSRLAKVITGFVVVSLTATEAMMFILFGRSEPVMDKPFGLAERAAAGGLRVRTLEFMSGANRLKGYVILPEAPRALMLAVHGVRASSDALEPVIEYFVRQSYAVMTFDGTASGRSEGSRTVGLQQQRYDVQAALAWIRQDPQLNGMPLVLLGHSAGAYGVAAETPASGAVASVCVSGFDSPLGTMHYWAEHYAGALTNVEYPFLWIREHAAKGGDANVSASRMLTSCGVPALVVHGSADEVIATQISLYQALQEHPGANVSTLFITDPRHRGHSDILVADSGLNTALLDRISAFLSPYVPGGRAYLTGERRLDAPHGF